MNNYFNIKGINIYYEVRGDLNSNKVVAFFNGVMASTTSWDLVVPIFEKLGFKIILHDFKGQLRSDKPDGPYTFLEHASEAKALFDHLKVEKVHLIGTSYGSEIAMCFSLMYPNVVETLSLIDGVSELDEVLEGFINNWEYLLDLNDGEKFFLGMAPIIYGNRYYKENKELLLKRASKFKKVDPSYFKGQRILYETFKNDVNMTNEIVNIKAPTLVIVGEDDLLKRVKFSKKIADTIPNTEYFVIPDCGHVPIFESPEELQTLLSGFIIKHL